MKKTLIGSLMALFLLAGFAAAQMPMGNGLGPRTGARWMQADDDDGEMDFGPRMHCLAGLELTDDQKKAVMELQNGHKKKMIETHSEMAGEMGKMKLFMIGDKFDSKGADALINKQADMHKKIAKERVRFMRSVRDLLTDDQKIIFDNNILSQGPGQGMMGHGKMGHGKMGKGMMGGGRRGMGRPGRGCQ